MCWQRVSLESSRRHRHNHMRSGCGARPVCARQMHFRCVGQTRSARKRLWNGHPGPHKALPAQSETAEPDPTGRRLAQRARRRAGRMAGLQSRARGVRRPMLPLSPLAGALALRSRTLRCPRKRQPPCSVGVKGLWLPLIARLLPPAVLFAPRDRRLRIRQRKNLEGTRSRRASEYRVRQRRAGRKKAVRGAEVKICSRCRRRRTRSQS